MTYTYPKVELSSTQSIDVFIDIYSNHHRVYDGLYLKAVIPGEKVSNAMEIPRNAIFNNDQVYVVQDTIVKVKEIEIRRVNTQTVIFSGIKEGEDLVVAPLINAHNNMRVWKMSDHERNKEESENVADSNAVESTNS